MTESQNTTLDLLIAFGLLVLVLAVGLPKLLAEVFTYHPTTLSLFPGGGIIPSIPPAPANPNVPGHPGAMPPNPFAPPPYDSGAGGGGSGGFE